MSEVSRRALPVADRGQKVPVVCGRHQSSENRLTPARCHRRRARAHLPRHPWIQCSQGALHHMEENSTATDSARNCTRSGKTIQGPPRDWSSPPIRLACQRRKTQAPGPECERLRCFEASAAHAAAPSLTATRGRGDDARVCVTVTSATTRPSGVWTIKSPREAWRRYRGTEAALEATATAATPQASRARSDAVLEL